MCACVCVCVRARMCVRVSVCVCLYHTASMKGGGPPILRQHVAYLGDPQMSGLHPTEEREVKARYHLFQNHYTHEIIIFKLFRGLPLQLSVVCRISLSYHFRLFSLIFVQIAVTEISSPQEFFKEFTAITVS